MLTRGRVAVPAIHIRTLILAVLAGLSSYEPTFSLRRGAYICFGLLLFSLYRARGTLAGVSAILLAVWAVASTEWAYDPTASSVTSKNQVACVVIFLAVRTVVQSRRDLLTVAVGYVIGCAYALIKLYQQVGSVPVDPATTDVRYGISGLNANYLAYALATGAVMVVLIWSTRPKRVRRVWLVLSAFVVTLLVWGILKNGTRGALISCALLGAWLLVCRPNWRRAPDLRTVTSLACAATIAVPMGWLNSILHSIDSDTTRATGDLSGRLTIWPEARHVLFQHPLNGIGDGSFVSYSSFGIEAHNVALDTGAGLGCVGIALLTLVLYGSLYRDTRAADPAARTLLVGALVLVETPITISGYWAVSPAGWFALAVISRIAVLVPAGERSRHPHAELNADNRSRREGRRQSQSAPTRRPQLSADPSAVHTGTARRARDCGLRRPL